MNVAVYDKFIFLVDDCTAVCTLQPATTASIALTLLIVVNIVIKRISHIFLRLTGPLSEMIAHASD